LFLSAVHEATSSRRWMFLFTNRSLIDNASD
jgi:hypothetical protein